MGAIGAAYTSETRGPAGSNGPISWVPAPNSDRTTSPTSQLDPFTELFTDHDETWMRLSEHLSAPELRRNEWYNGFVLRCGVGDVIAAQITTRSHTAVFGIHEGIRRKAALHIAPQASELTAESRLAERPRFNCGSGSLGMEIRRRGARV